MKIYLASRYGRRRELAEYARYLMMAGHEITSRWLHGTHEAADGDKSRWSEFANNDIEDIARSHLVISFTESNMHPRGSRHVEFGIAMALNKKLIVVGPVENVFHALPEVLRYDTWGEFVKGWLSASVEGQGVAV